MPHPLVFLKVSAMPMRAVSNVSKLMCITLISTVLSLISIQSTSAVIVNDNSSSCPIDVIEGTSDSVTVTLSGIYCVVQFKKVDTYTVTVPTGIAFVDYLVVGGGGGGASGGGGAGGVLQGNNYSVTSGETLTIVVGAGGAGGTGGAGFVGTLGVSGSSSKFGTITALGGGGGGTGGQIARSGASGGGSRYNCTRWWWRWYWWTNST